MKFKEETKEPTATVVMEMGSTDIVSPIKEMKDIVENVLDITDSSSKKEDDDTDEVVIEYLNTVKSLLSICKKLLEKKNARRDK